MRNIAIGMYRSLYIGLSVFFLCVYLFAGLSQKSNVLTTLKLNVLPMTPMPVSDDNAVCYAFPVLWMASRFSMTEDAHFCENDKHGLVIKFRRF